MKRLLRRLACALGYHGAEERVIWRGNSGVCVTANFCPACGRCHTIIPPEVQAAIDAQFGPEWDGYLGRFHEPR